MASLTDMAPTPISPSWNGAAEIAKNTIDINRASTQKGIDLQRNTDQYNNVTIPGITNAAASLGDFYGGQRQHDVGPTGQAAVAYQNSQADINSAFSQKKADLLRSSFLATTGISI